MFYSGTESVGLNCLIDYTFLQDIIPFCDHKLLFWLVHCVSLLLEDKLVRKAGARLDTLGEEVETRTTLSPTLKHLYGTNKYQN